MRPESSTPCASEILQSDTNVRVRVKICELPKVSRNTRSVRGPPGSGKSHLAQAIGQAVIQQGYRVLYRETHTLLDELAEPHHRRLAQRVHGVASLATAADPRRSGHAQTATDGGGRSTGAHHASLRACQYAGHLQSPGGRLGQTAGRCGRCWCHARSPAASRPRLEVWSTQAAHKNGLVSCTNDCRRRISWQLQRRPDHAPSAKNSFASCAGLGAVCSSTNGLLR